MFFGLLIPKMTLKIT